MLLIDLTCTCICTQYQTDQRQGGDGSDWSDSDTDWFDSESDESCDDSESGDDAPPRRVRGANGEPTAGALGM